MKSSQTEFRTGIMFIAAIVILVMMTAWFGKQSLISFGDDYTVEVRFHSTPGITRNSPVYKNGVQIGRVSSVALVDDDREVAVSILIHKNKKIYSDEECRVKQTVLTGNATLEFVKIRNFSGPVELVGPDSPPLQGRAASDLLSGFSGIEADLSKVVQNANLFLDRINSLVGSPDDLKEKQSQLDGIIGEVRASLTSFRQFSDGAGQLIGDPDVQSNLKRTVNELPTLLNKADVVFNEFTTLVRESRVMVERSQKSFEKFDAGFDNLDKGLGGIAKLSEQLGADAPELLDKLKKSASKLENLFDELTILVSAANEADGTVKRLMRDPAVYEKLVHTMDQAEKITQEVRVALQTDIKPITNNVKVITDKMARDPSVMIRNLFRKQPSIKNGLPIWGDGLGSDLLAPDDCYYNFDRLSEQRLSPVSTNCFANLLRTGSSSSRSQCTGNNCAMTISPTVTMPYSENYSEPMYEPTPAPMLPKDSFDSEEPILELQRPARPRPVIETGTLSTPTRLGSLPVLNAPFQAKNATYNVTSAQKSPIVQVAHRSPSAPQSASSQKVPVESGVPRQTGRVICTDPRYPELYGKEMK